jgi:hypothetical protein
LCLRGPNKSYVLRNKTTTMSRIDVLMVIYKCGGVSGIILNFKFNNTAGLFFRKLWKWK